MFFKRKPLTISRQNCVALNAAMFALNAHSQLFGRGQTLTLRDVTIKTEPFASIADEWGRVVYSFDLKGSVQNQDLFVPVSDYFDATIYVRMSEGRDCPPEIAYEGWHELVVGLHKFRVIFEACNRLTMAPITVDAYGRDDCDGPYRHSNETLPLEVLPYEMIHSVLYGLRIRTLGHLMAWSRSQLLEHTKDPGVVDRAEEILRIYGYEFKPG